MKYIKSRQNPEVKAVYALHKANMRAKQQAFIAEGKRACITLIKAKTTLHTLYLTEENLDHMHSYVHEKNFCIVTSAVMKKISQAVTPSGILGVFSKPTPPSIDTISSGIVFAQLMDPGNMGTLIRTCAALKVPSVVIIGGVDPWSFKVVQASAGYITHVPLFQLTWSELTKIVKKKGLTLSALIVSGGKKPELVKKEKTLLVIGSEAHGISKDWLDQCHEHITLHMPGNIESLNATVAASIALYLIFTKKS
jgi:TrmH family RNA methyltransferase